MDWNVHALEQLVAMRLEEARARSAHASLVASLRPRRVDALAVLGLGLIKLGRFVHASRWRAAPGRVPHARQPSRLTHRAPRARASGKSRDIVRIAI
jgi:hypothetical protein